MTLAKYNINVNTIAPDVINIPIWKKVDTLFTKYEHRPSGKKKNLVGQAAPSGTNGIARKFYGSDLISGIF